MLDFTVTKMLRQTKVDHFQFRVFCGTAKEEILQLQITMDDPLGMQITNCAEHLFDQSSTLGFGVVVVRLLVQAVKELAAEA
jgi:hypothetical protein